MEISPLSALSPLDGRYAGSVDALRPFFSEEALMRARVEVEVRYFIALSQEKGIKELPPLNARQVKDLWAIIVQFDAREAEAIKKIEATTRHDVKAVEYYLQQKIGRIRGLGDKLSFIHFALTSEDTNNLAYGLLIHRALKGVIHPALKELIKELLKAARAGNGIRMLSLTHGQPATPTTIDKEIMVFVERLSYQIDQLTAFMKYSGMKGKFGGAVGNYSAHKAAYPNVRWEGFNGFGRKFVKSLGFRFPLVHSTQINPHDDLAELSHLLFRINTIGINLSRDVWMYISRGIFRQRVVAGEVGSSTMPHKVNPIDFENAEGNFGLSNALFSHFAEKLPISRLQRDLSDSTVQRNIGIAFGYHLLAVHSLLRGLRKLSIDHKRVAQELSEHPEVHAEAIQMILRKYGVKSAYEQLKALTRGEKITTDQLRSFVEGLELPEAEKKRLWAMIA